MKKRAKFQNLDAVNLADSNRRLYSQTSATQ